MAGNPLPPNGGNILKTLLIMKDQSQKAAECRSNFSACCCSTFAVLFNNTPRDKKSNPILALLFSELLQGLFYGMHA